MAPIRTHTDEKSLRYAAARNAARRLRRAIESDADAAARKKAHTAAVADWRDRNPETPAQAEARRKWDRARLQDPARRAQKRVAEMKRKDLIEGGDIIVPLAVLEAGDGVCGICLTDVDPLDFQVDHVIPISRGGTHTYDNVQVAHGPCNASKNAHMPWDLQEAI